MERGVQGAAWVEKLLAGEYDALTTGERVDALVDLLHLALDLPSMHSSLDRHHEEVERQKRLIREEAKEERKNRQKEMAARHARDAEVAQARVDALRQKMLTGAAPLPLQRGPLLFLAVLVRSRKHSGGRHEGDRLRCLERCVLEVAPYTCVLAL